MSLAEDEAFGMGFYFSEEPTNNLSLNTTGSNDSDRSQAIKDVTLAIKERNEEVKLYRKQTLQDAQKDYADLLEFDQKDDADLSESIKGCQKNLDTALKKEYKNLEKAQKSEEPDGKQALIDHIQREIKVSNYMMSKLRTALCFYSKLRRQFLLDFTIVKKGRHKVLPGLTQDLYTKRTEEISKLELLTVAHGDVLIGEKSAEITNYSEIIMKMGMETTNW